MVLCCRSCPGNDVLAGSVKWPACNLSSPYDQTAVMSYELIAGVDLGSNSFRLQIGRVVGNRIHPLDT
jgi:hypothetical protein